MKITFTWVKPSSVPDMNMPLLVMTENNKLMAFKDSMTFYGGDKTKAYSDWENMVRKYKIKYWVYQQALLEKKLIDL